MLARSYLLWLGGNERAGADTIHGSHRRFVFNQCYRSNPDMRSSAREIADYLSDEYVALRRKQ